MIICILYIYAFCCLFISGLLTLISPSVCTNISLKMMTLTFDYWVTTTFLRTLLSILADLNNTVVWMLLIHPLISNSSNLLCEPFQANQLLLLSPSPSCFISFLNSLARSEYLSIFLLSFIFTHRFISFSA